MGPSSCGSFVKVVTDSGNEGQVLIPRGLLRRKRMASGAAGEVPLHQGGHADWSGHLDSCILLSFDDTPICIAIDATRELYTEITSNFEFCDF